MTFISDDVNREFEKYTFEERCKILVDISRDRPDDEDLDEFFDYEDESMKLAEQFVNLNSGLSTDEIELIDNQFRSYILISNGWHL